MEEKKALVKDFSVKIQKNKNKYGQRLIDCFMSVKDIEEGELTRVDSEIKTMLATLDYIFRSVMVEDPKKPGQFIEKSLSSDDIKAIILITKNLVSAKEVRRKLEKELKLDVATVEEFTIEMLKIVKKVCPDHLARKVMGECLSLIRLYRDEGRISDDNEMDLMETSVSQSVFGDNGKN